MSFKTTFKDSVRNSIQNMKDFKELQNQKSQGSKNSKHMEYRKIRIPKTNMHRRMRKTFSQEFKNGSFRNDIYFDLSPAFIAWVYIKNILLYCIPAIMLHGMISFINMMSSIILKTPHHMTSSMIQILVITYAIGTVFGLRKTSDHMAYYNTIIITSKYNINRKMAKWIATGRDKTNAKEFKVMDHYRMKFNKQILFPTVKELAVVEQLYRKDKNSSKENKKNIAITRKERLDFYNREEEHEAAKEIADWKQEQNGGVNEYDEMVKKYQKRTIPAIREIIREVKSFDFDLDDDLDLEDE